MRRRKMNKQNIKKEQTETAKKRHEDSIRDCQEVCVNNLSR